MTSPATGAPPATSGLKLSFALAVQGGRVREVALLLADHPGAARWNDIGGGTALRKAIAHGSPSLEVVTLLLDEGADIDARDKDGMTPLMFAALHKASACVALLLQRGAATALADNRGRTAAAIALETGYPGIAATIRTHAEKLARDIAEKARLKAEDEAAPHTGLTRPLVVKKPFTFKR